MDTPRVMERRRRGREMVMHDVHSDGGRKTLMYEGYEDGKKYLVPDSKLRVMKELVEMKMGKPPKERYLRDYEFSSRRKSSDSQDSDKSEEEFKQRKIQFADEPPPKEPTVDAKSESETTSSSSESPLETTPEKSDETLAAERFVVPPDDDADRFRFFLSGHIRSNLRPIFIVHTFSGRPLFGEETADFRSATKEGNVDLFVSGKFYKDTVLQEIDGVAKSLIIKPQKILIDERSKIFEEYINLLFRVGGVELEVDGQFLKSANAKKYTPFMTFSVNKSPPSSPPRPKESSPKSQQVYRVQSTDSSDARKPFLDLGRQVVYFVPKPQTNNNMFNPKPTKNEELKVDSRTNPTTEQRTEEPNSLQVETSPKKEVDESDSYVMKNYHATLSFVSPSQNVPPLLKEQSNTGDSSSNRASMLGSIAKRFTNYMFPKNK